MNASPQKSANSGLGLIRAASAWLVNLLYRRTVLVVSLLFFLAVLIAVAHVYFLQRELVRSGATQGAQLQSETLSALRAYYTSEVVERIRPHGVEVSHDYRNKPNAVPLPATFTIGLSEKIGSMESGQ